MYRILIIDDEKNIRQIFSLLLRDYGHDVESAGDGGQGIRTAARLRPDLVLLDMNLPDMPGLAVLQEIRKLLPETEVIIMTAFGTIKSAVEATRLGAYDYLEKPVDNEALLLTIDRALERRTLQRRVAELQGELDRRFRFANIIGSGRRMNTVFQAMEKIAAVDGSVLITGESGTGKELAAKAIHFHSRRRNGPFVSVNCGAIPRELFESEFFGHTRGAFTDARSDKAGKFEQAAGGTLFLDEVGELPPEAQVKFLRVLGEREIVRIGGQKTIPVDVRVIAATNRNLGVEVGRGAFREDLYWRLAVLSIELPPLRERREDIPLLSSHFLGRFRDEVGKNVSGFSADALACLSEYPWPGNVRELESVVYEAMVFCDGPVITRDNLPPRISGDTRPIGESPLGIGGDTRPIGESPLGIGGDTRPIGESPLGGDESPAPAAGPTGLRPRAAENERRIIVEALQACRGNRSETARRLGISRKTLFNKMKRLGID